VLYAQQFLGVAGCQRMEDERRGVHCADDLCDAMAGLCPKPILGFSEDLEPRISH
jgi:hypothetical protein